MLNKKTKYSLLILSLSLLVLAIVTVTVLSVTGAWFTDYKSGKSNITTATVAVAAKRGTPVSEIDTVIINATEVAGTNLLGSNPITFVSTSNIDVYVRAVVTLNWATNNASYEDVYSCFNVTIPNTWKPSGSSNFGSYIYYGANITNNTAYSLVSSISLKSGKTMPSDLVVNVFVEAVQKDTIGKDRFQATDASLTNVKWTSIYGA